ncbi:3-dehydroquinate synthase [Candidatus Methylacidiphilum fumarolicum]|uniref:3-dehydroquinate synthase n=2 Tax=Candidatus Methylacidiphilum fumarolicum TaxID=591154 RepID=I0JWV8_METFB|nr:3-dehydroquinate synthase [Candidatus Methylacidiphilum fumarolicum]MBW6414422.1 3-dehydroquinate synthase [Candidatus Methylacidiphilum fumarolicum]TFE69424.1 3-dehydroquinate synthase [Candidatus Methylacidiphilum fumarolicum]TFE72870.1 3-dehydroquinate synthase [Candidatus Methylacidiphilum fumarolicum]TFE74613.1 3-dehydroquinate synthase [Candidatus Methylacidiphilum fumarolicum]TFE77180.1 3-dehydroquinate synthase [Candidatus Methylacidiphilum fumarolicum]
MNNENLIIRVSTPSRNYLVRIGRGLLQSSGLLASQLGLKDRVVLLHDEAVKTYALQIVDSLKGYGFKPEIISIASGEKSKSFRTLEAIVKRLADMKLDRKSTLLALGGGVTGDLVGFAASIFLRGISFILIPTTLLAMVDSSIGGKTGINLPQGKNLIGSFYQPLEVWIDPEVLHTLSPRLLSAGMAEVIKYGMIAEEKLLEEIEKKEEANLLDLIKRSVEIKAKIVSEDEQEKTGKRAILNFGHTLGHALEAANKYKDLLHGEAVAIGMHAACLLSNWLLAFPLSAIERLKHILQLYSLPLTATGFSKQAIFHALDLDKKRVQGVNSWILLQSIGFPVVSKEVKKADIDRVLKEIVQGR